MSRVQLCEDVSEIRALFFPFFDRTEIFFTLSILAAECVTVYLVQLVNGWALPFGSYIGMVAVARTVLPSYFALIADEVPTVRQIFDEMKMRETKENHFVPSLPAALRWPRNVVVLHGGDRPRLEGPGGILRQIEGRLEDFRNRTTSR